MTIVDTVMTRQVVSVDAADTVRAVSRLLARRRIGGVVVTDGGLAVGMVTERDLVSRVLAQGLDPDATTAGAVMTRPLVTVEPSAPLEEAIAIMRRLGIKRLVVALDDELRGILTATDVAYARPELTRDFIESWVKQRWED